MDIVAVAAAATRSSRLVVKPAKHKNAAMLQLPFSVAWVIRNFLYLVRVRSSLTDMENLHTRTFQTESMYVTVMRRNQYKICRIVQIIQNLHTNETEPFSFFFSRGSRNS